MLAVLSRRLIANRTRGMSSSSKPRTIYRGSTRGGVLESQIKVIEVAVHKRTIRDNKLQSPLQYIGGTAQIWRYPTTLRIQNIGLDDRGATQWSVIGPVLPEGLLVYDLEVSYEGLRGRGDYYVRKGSAIVRCKVDYKNPLIKYVIRILLFCIILSVVIDGYYNHDKKKFDLPNVK